MTARKTPKKRSTASRNAKAVTRDPRGGLTAAGRKEFLKKDGSHLKPGVKKPVSGMTAEDMRRKGSWAVRFYGRKGPLPPLVKENGEPVPKNATAARAIAKKGHTLLAKAKQHQKMKAKKA